MSQEIYTDGNVKLHGHDKNATTYPEVEVVVTGNGGGGDVNVGEKGGSILFESEPCRL